MSRSALRKASSLVYGTLLAGVAGYACAQQVTNGVGFGQLNHSFFEQSGIGFDFKGPSFFFQQNSFGLATPQFGGFDPGAGATFGFGVPMGKGQANFNFAFGQGAQTSMTSSSPSVTVGNGGFGAFSAGSWTPFVAGAIPVVGDAPIANALPFGPAGSNSLLGERLSRLNQESLGPANPPAVNDAASEMEADSTLDHFQRSLARAHATAGGAAQMSVARIAELQAAERAAVRQAKQAVVARLIAKGDAALASGKSKVARIYFQQAARRADGTTRAQLLDRISTVDVE